MGFGPEMELKLRALEVGASVDTTAVGSAGHQEGSEELMLGA